MLFCRKGAVRHASLLDQQVQNLPSLAVGEYMDAALLMHFVGL